MALVWSNNPSYADIADYNVREAKISVAVVKQEDSSGQVLFKFSSDGETWPDDSEAIEVGTISKPKPLSLVVRGAVIEITDGASILFTSIKSGIEGSW